MAGTACCPKTPVSKLPPEAPDPMTEIWLRLAPADTVATRASLVTFGLLLQLRYAITCASLCHFSHVPGGHCVVQYVLRHTVRSVYKRRKSQE